MTTPYTPRDNKSAAFWGTTIFWEGQRRNTLFRARTPITRAQIDDMVELLRKGITLAMEDLKKESFW